MVFRGNSTDTFEMSDTEVYQLVKDGSLKSFPHGMWDGVSGIQTAKKILKYVFENILEWSIEDIKRKSDRKIFEEYKLNGMLSSVFDGSMYIAIGETYPELKEWADFLYETNEHADFDHKRYTDDELINILLEKVKELNRIPKVGEMSKPSAITYNKRFGSWGKALMKAELIEDIYKDIDFKKITRDEVMWKLKNLFSDKERVLDKDELEDVYPEGVIKEYFGNYNKVEKLITGEYTKDDLIKILKNKKEKLGRIPTNKDMKFPRAITFIDNFGSWQKAIDGMEE